MTVSFGEGTLLVAVILTLVGSVIAGAGGAALASPAANDAVNWDSDHTDDFYVYEEEVVISNHNRSDMSAVTDYYGDDGDVKSLPVTLNDSIDNRVRFRMDKVDDDGLTKFPRSNENDSAVDNASAWTAGGTNATKVSITATSTAEGVEAVEVSTSGMATGDSAYAEYTLSSPITSDAEKRVASEIFNVNSLSGTAYFAYVDDDGDEKRVTIDSAGNVSQADVAANATGNGWVHQSRLSEIPTTANGDGTFDSISSVRVLVVDGDASVTSTHIDADRKSTFKIGERLENTDSDDALETVTVEEVREPGEILLEDVSTMGEEFDDAVINDLVVRGLEYRESQLASEDVYVNVTEADAYPNYAKLFQQAGGITVPTAIDLSHSGLSLRVEQGMVSERYLKFRYAEGIGDKEPSDVSSWTDASGQLSDDGSLLTLDSTIQPGATIMPQVQKKVRQGEFDALTRSPSGGATGPVGSGGGIIDMILSPFGALVGLAGAFMAALRKIGV